MRLIDAGALRARMYHDAFETDSDMQKWDGGCWIRYKMFENAIEDAPTIEPKKGRWVKAERDGVIVYSDAYAQCSMCKEVTFLGWKMKYCPNCGAKMEEENE